MIHALIYFHQMFFRGVFVPFGSQHRNERISAIALELSKGEHDIVILQEVRLLIIFAYII